MLLYVSSGSRDFGRQPIAPYRRECWEFYAVLRGRIGPVLAAGETSPPLSAASLWLFPPDHAHGWRGESFRSARIAVFHFDAVAPALAARVPAGGFLRTPLAPGPARALVRLARELQPFALEAGDIAPLRAERAMIELGLLMLEPLLARAPRPVPPDRQRVALAERWFAAHLSTRPTLDQLACRMGVSLARMRRLFVSVRGCAPKSALERIRLARAESLLVSSDLKLSAVAAASGYASASVFVQAFRRARGLTPDAWRRARA